jgi:hypothetical protein
MSGVGSAPRRRRAIIYAAAAAAVVVLLVVGLLVYSSAKHSKAADDKAGRLRSAFSAAGLPVPDRNEIVRVLGEDGGPMCTDPTNYLHKAILQYSMSNGAAGPGIRPVISDKQVVQGEVLAITIYCPQRLPEFTSYLTHLKFADVIKE